VSLSGLGADSTAFSYTKDYKASEASLAL